MSKFISVPQIPQGIGGNFLEDQLKAQAQEVPAIQTATPQEMGESPSPMEVPAPTYTGMTADESAPDDYYGKEDQLFRDDYLDKFGVDNYGDLFQDEGAGAGRPFLDKSGEVIPSDQVMALREQEVREQQQRAMSLAELTRFRTKEDLINTLGDSVLKPTVAAAPVRASKDLGLALINQTIKNTAGEEVNGLSRLADAYGVTTRTAANMGTLAMTTLLPLAVGNARKMKPRSTEEGAQAVDYDVFDDNSDSFAAINSMLAGDEEGPVNLQHVGGMLTRESFETATGRMANIFRKSRNATDAQGRPINQETAQQARISNTEAGAAYTQSMIDAGYLEEHVINGVPVVTDTKKGLEYYIATRELEHSVTGKLAARSQKVPVSDTGETIGASRVMRPGDMKKPGYQPLTQVDEGKRIFGSIGKLSSPIKGFHALNLFKMLLDQLNNNGVPTEGNIDVFGFFKIAQEDLDDARLPDDDPSKKNTLKNKLNLLASEFFEQGKHMADGTPNFTKYRDDYSTHRQYQDSQDFNEQRNKLTRALMVYTSKPSVFSGSSYHKNGVSADDAKKFWNDIGRKARDRDFKLSNNERELSFLALVGRILDVSSYAGVGIKTENMPIPDMMRLITPTFLVNAANIGRQLRSLVPSSTKDIVNEVLSVAQGVDNKFNRGIKQIPGDAKYIKPIYNGQMTEAQQNAMLTWLNTSDRDDYGYKLQAYLDVANYMDSKESGKPFIPRSTVAIDMNSAGRTFLAMDVGKEEILTRVGLIWDHFTDKEFQDVTGGQDPRAYFTEVAVKEGVEAAFGSSDHEKITAWKNAFARFEGNKAFNKDFGKKVLLTTDYGKAMMYHHEEAIAFLNSHPSFKEEMLEYYQGDFNKLVEQLNEIYFATLNKASDSWQYALPKQIVKLLQMFGRVPAPVGYYNEKISIGKSGQIDTGEEVTIKGRKGEVTRRLKKHVDLDPEAKAKNKNLKDYEGNHMQAPGPGTAAINGIGPVMGQYRESLVILETARYLNSDKQPADMLNLSPVFDNFILDTDSYLMTMYVANNIVVPKIMEWNMAQNFEKDFHLQLAEIDAELKKAGNTIVINDKSPYKGIFTVLDREYGYIKDTKDSELSDSERLFKNQLLDPRSGYIPKESRPDNVLLTRDQMMKLYAITAKKFRVMENMKKWTKDLDHRRADAQQKIKNRARRCEIYFFT